MLQAGVGSAAIGAQDPGPHLTPRIREEREFLQLLVKAEEPGERQRLWQRFFDDYHPVVVWTARKNNITVDEDREDLWGELLFKLMRDDCRLIQGFLANPDHTDTSFRSYLRTAATNLARSQHRKAKRANLTELHEWQADEATLPGGGQHSAGTNNPAGLDFGSRWTTEFITWLLPDRSSSSYQVFALKALADLSNREISTELDISPANVAQKIHYFKVKLLSALIGTSQVTASARDMLGERRTILLQCLKLSDAAIRWWKELIAGLNSLEEPHTHNIFSLQEANYEFHFISKVVKESKEWVIRKHVNYRQLVADALGNSLQVARELRRLLTTGRSRIDKVFFEKDGLED